MSENGSKFEFAEAYRKLQPGVDRSIVGFREVTHRKVRKDLPKSADKIVDLARLAFDIPVTGGRTPVWLEEIAKENDAHFSLEHDRNEARIVATILLADMLASAFPGTSALVLTGSFAGRRQTVDQERIVMAARSALAGMGRTRRLGFSTQMAAARWQDTGKAVVAANAGDAVAVHAALEAIAAEAKAAEVRMVEKFNSALTSLTNENRRLAEEVDLLWWRMGRWSYLLDRPLSEVDGRALPFVIGTDIAAMINVLPGPHGALGIIRDALGSESESRQTIKDTFQAVPIADRAALLENVKSELDPIASLNVGLRLYEDDAISASIPALFAKYSGLSIDTELSRFEIAVQAFYERMLIKSGWV